jgi:hypothetical protein
MLKFLATMFGGQGRRPVRVAQLCGSRLGVEELSSRILPSAGCGGAAAGASTQAARGALFSSAIAGTDDSFDHGGHECGAAHASLSASLSNSSGATGTATFSESNGVLKVSVTGAAASTSLAVSVDGTSVGTVTTDASGNGSAKLTGVTASAGSTVLVGDLTGTFAQVKLSASLTGTTGVTGTASFNTLTGKLRVSASGLTAGTTYDVAVGGTTVGQITANSAGRGKLHVSPTGVTIASGSMVTFIATGDTTAILSGTFA